MIRVLSEWQKCQQHLLKTLSVARDEMFSWKGIRLLIMAALPETILQVFLYCAYGIFGCTESAMASTMRWVMNKIAMGCKYSILISRAHENIAHAYKIK